MADNPEWVTFTNANPYRKMLQVRLRKDMIAGYEENVMAEYDGNLPNGIVQRSFIYTVGGNQFMVGERIGEIDKLLGVDHAR